MSDSNEIIWELNGFIGAHYYNRFFLIHPSYKKEVKDGIVFFKTLSGNSLRRKIAFQGKFNLIGL